MRISKLNKLLKLWQKNNLISEEQTSNIRNFMKERQKETFFRFLKWISIIAVLWLVFGIITSIINLLQLNFMKHILEFLVSFFGTIKMYICQPIYNLFYKLLGANCKFFFWGVVTLALFVIFNFFAVKRKNNTDIDKLNLSDEQKYILKSYYTLDILASICLAATFCLFNMILLPEHSYSSSKKIFPFVNCLGAITFIIGAYRYSKSTYLLFGIYFVALTVGMFTGYGHATYWIGVSRPVIQIFVAIIILLIGYISELKLNPDNENFMEEKFISIYNWTGLLMLFIALWICSLWGFDIDLGNSVSGTVELWIANILFIVASVFCMYIGARTEKKLFFNYGLTFLIIETYTIFLSNIWELMPVGIASIILGCMLLATVKILKKIYLKKTKS